MASTKSKTHVCFVSAAGVKDKAAWSGTQSRMYDALCGEFEKISPVGPLRIRHFLLIGKIIDKICSAAFGNGYNYLHTPFAAKILGWANARKIKEIMPDVLFAPAGAAEISYLQTEIPICYLSDTSFGQIIEYYQNFSKFSKTGNENGIMVERRAINNSTKIIYSSAWAADFVVEKYGIERNKIIVIPFGANIESWPQKSAVLPKKTNLPWRLLFLGVSWSRKGGDLAFEAVRQMRAEGHDVVLTVCGCKPPVEADWLEVIPFLDKAIPFENNRFVELMKEAHLLFLPTRAEAFGIVFCEASAYGIPSITTRTGGTSAAVQEGINGFLLGENACPSEYANLIIGLLQNESKYHAICESSRAHFEKSLNWESWAKSIRVEIENLSKVKTSDSVQISD